MSPEANTTRFSGPELCRLQAHTVVSLLRRREVSPEDVLEAALARISQVEHHVNAMPTRCEQRAQGAIRTGRENWPARCGEPGWLGGLPIGIKDLNAVAGVRTTMGTLGLRDFVPAASDCLVERLEELGAVVVGKTNTPEMGAGGNTSNAVFGMTRNPWDLGKNAGGSSGGAAVSLATGEVWLSHGSDLAGSLRTPAAYCGVIGLRPSPGRVAGGPTPTAFNFESVQGPMARSVRDAALFLDAMAGFDPRSPISIEAPRTPFQQAVLQAEPGIKVAYSPDLAGFAPVDPEIECVLRDALCRLQKCGAAVEEDCPNLPGLYPTYITLRALVWASGPGRMPDALQSHFKQTLKDNIETGRRLTIDRVCDALRGRAELYQSVRTFLNSYDVLACPVVGCEPGPVEEEFPQQVGGEPVTDYVDWLRFSFLSTVTGLPSISVPAGFTAAGMPVGLQLIGPPRGEARLLAAAKVVEDVLNPGGTTPIDPRQVSP